MTGDTLTYSNYQHQYEYITRQSAKSALVKFLVPPSNGSDKHSKKSSWNVLNVAIIIKTVKPQDSAGHGAGVHPLPCLDVPGDIGDQPVHKPEDFRVDINS